MIIGRCHICGEVGKLTREHIPPRSAFNKDRIIEVTSNSEIIAIPEQGEKFRQIQGGHFKYTLCSRCNNNTGSWYGDTFVKWCIRGMELLERSNGKPSIISCYMTLPLRIIKQIVSLFLSVNFIEFRDANPGLVRFVLNRETKGIPSAYRLYTYYSTSTILRFTPFLGHANISTMQERVFSEITFPPYGYILTFDSDPPDENLYDITHFSQFRYSELAHIEMKPIIKEVNTFIPGDYRSHEEIFSTEPEKSGKMIYNGESIVESIRRLIKKMTGSG